MIRINNFIFGEHCPPETNQYSLGVNPATGETFYDVSLSGEKDVNAAVEAAKNAFLEWSQMSVYERASILNRLSDLIMKNRDRLARLESQDSGKPYKLAYDLEIPRSARNFSFFSAASIQFSSESHSANNAYINYTLRQALGVVVCISPWNLPLYLLTWKIAPALASGNCIVAKPSSITPMTAHALTELSQEAGLPKGVLNIVYGSGKKLSDFLCTHKDVKAISFTGGTETGMEISKKVAPHFKKYSLEMGGKNAAIIFEDCNFEKMIETTVLSSFNNQGQICLCTPRILIQKPLYEKFKKAFVEKVLKLKVGDPMIEDNNLGAVVSLEQKDRIIQHIKNARLEGGKILCGGEEPPTFSDTHLSKGFFINPTVIEGLPAHANINQQEVFGPVVTLTPFSSEEEAIELANSTSFGLAVTLWTQDVSRAHRLAEKVEVGIVWVNTWMMRDLRTPFGGMKNSGVGREGGLEAMHFFTEPKNVCISYQ